MGRLYATIRARDAFDVPTRVRIWRTGTGSWPARVVGGAYRTEGDGYTDEYAVIYEGHQVGTVEIGIFHSSHGGVYPDDKVAEYRRACQAVYDVL